MRWFSCRLGDQIAIRSEQKIIHYRGTEESRKVVVVSRGQQPSLLDWPSLFTTVILRALSQVELHCVAALADFARPVGRERPTLHSLFRLLREVVGYVTLNPGGASLS